MYFLSQLEFQRVQNFIFSLGWSKIQLTSNCNWYDERLEMLKKKNLQRISVSFVVYAELKVIFSNLLRVAY